MALQANVTLDSGINLPEAYIVVIVLGKYFLDSLMNIKVCIYKDQSSYNSKKTEVSTLIYSLSGSDFTTYFSEDVLKEEGKTSLTQAYEYLKTIYSGATEV